MKPIGATVVVVSLMAILSIAAVGAASAQDRTTITVSVTDQNGDPIQGATVTAEWDESAGVDETQDSGTSRSNGNVLLDIPTDADGANVEVSAEHPDYVQNIPVRVDDASEEVSVEMAEPGALVMEIVDTEGSPVANVNIRIRHTDNTIVDVVETGPDGGAQRNDLEQREYIVETFRAGYLTNRTQVVLDRSAVNHETKIERRNVEIEFTVTDSYRNEPLEGATIMINGSPEGTTASDGSQVSRRGVNDNYEITVDKDGYDAVTRSLRIAEESKEFEVSVRRTPSVSIDQLSSSVVTGQRTQIAVTNAYDDPISNARVFVNGEMITRTNEQGEATVQVNQTGENTVEVRSGDAQSSATIQGIEESTDDEEEVEPDPEPEDDSDDGGSDSLGPGFGVVTALAALLGISIALSRRRKRES